MEDEPKQPPEKTAGIDWADLRERAAKLGISLSELQRQEREREARQARKSPFKRPFTKETG